MDQVNNAFVQLIPAYSCYSTEFFQYNLNGKFPTFREFLENADYCTYADSWFRECQTQFQSMMKITMAVIRAIEDPSECNMTACAFQSLARPKHPIGIFDYIEYASLKEGIDYVRMDGFENKRIQFQRISKQIPATIGPPMEIYSYDIEDNTQKIDKSVFLCWNGVRKIVKYMVAISASSIPGLDFYMKNIEESYHKIKKIDDFNKSKIEKAISREKFAELNFDLKEEHDDLEEEVTELKNTINDLKANYVIKADEKSLDNKRIEDMINGLEAKRLEDKKHLEDIINYLETKRLEDKKHLEDMINGLKDTVNVTKAKDISLKCDQDSTKSMVITLCGKVKFTITSDLNSILSDLDSRIKSDTYDVHFYETFDEAKEEIYDNISGVVIIENIKNDAGRAMKFFKNRS